MKKTKWKPAVGEGYFYIHLDIGVRRDRNENTPTDIERIDFGNCFKTEAEAIAARDEVRELLNNL